MFKQAVRSVTLSLSSSFALFHSGSAIRECKIHLLLSFLSISGLQKQGDTEDCAGVDQVTQGDCCKG